MSTVITTTSVYTNRTFPFDKIELSQLEKRNRKYYIDYTIDDTPIFLQINRVRLLSEPIFIDDEQGYIDIEVHDRVNEISNYFKELDNYNQLICYKNCEEWLGKNLEMTEIEDVYKTSYKDNVLRLKIEKETVKMYDMSKKKLSIESDLKQGDILDVIMEISGLKLMKSAFSTHIILRQIRKHPQPVPKKKPVVPTDYLFLDEYSQRHKGVIRDDNSVDDQTDIDAIPAKKSSGTTKGGKKPITELMGSKKESDSEDENTRDYLSNLNNILRNHVEDSSDEESDVVSRKDKILDALENGELALGSMVSSVSKSIKIPKSKLKTNKKGNTKYTDDELHKNI
jgi:hypothetical protein